MITIHARNVHAALYEAMCDMRTHLRAGDRSSKYVRRASRNGDVIVAIDPVTTAYRFPRERVVFWPERDANPFFHLVESLWMLAGRDDLATVERYVGRMREFSDDGETLHGAYGYRWRQWPELDQQVGGFWGDQIGCVIDGLRADPDCRRQVVSMWRPNDDLGRAGRDVPCNLAITFQLDASHEALDMATFCRSNDVIWGAYGANAVHLSMLQEYIALALGVEVGRWWQVSVNWHAYDNDQLRRCIDIASDGYVEPYESTSDRRPAVRPMALFEGPGEREAFDADLEPLLSETPPVMARRYRTAFARAVALPMISAHIRYREELAAGTGARAKLTAIREARRPLADMPADNDWRRAAFEWLDRRERRLQLPNPPEPKEDHPDE